MISTTEKHIGNVFQAPAFLEYSQIPSKSEQELSYFSELMPYLSKNIEPMKLPQICILLVFHVMRQIPEKNRTGRVLYVMRQIPEKNQTERVNF